MGLGKTYTGSAKLEQLGERVNLIICQKSKVDDWVNHFNEHYSDRYIVFDLTNKREFENYMKNFTPCVGIINYELAFRRAELAKLKDFTLMLDESSLIQNEKAKRSKFILNKLKPRNVILLSGSPTGGRYERLWSQMKLLGWEISKDLYWKQFVDFYYLEKQGFPLKIIKGYKNVERLKTKMREHGARFLKTDEVMDLPEQVFQDIKVNCIPQYKKFHKNGITMINGEQIVGDTTLTNMLKERMLCGIYNKDKLNAVRDLLESTDDRIIIFYNFTNECYAIEDICYELEKPVSIVSGHEKDLTLYDECDNCVTLIQYQAGSYGLNLQKANKIVYFTPPLSSEVYEQSKKRTHRIGQSKTCFYYRMICEGSIEERIYATLDMRRDYTDRLFEQE